MAAQGTSESVADVSGLRAFRIIRITRTFSSSRRTFVFCRPCHTRPNSADAPSFWVQMEPMCLHNAGIVKAVRLMRIFRFVMALRMLVSSIVNTLKSLFWALVLLLGPMPALFRVLRA